MLNRLIHMGICKTRSVGAADGAAVELILHITDGIRGVCAADTGCEVALRGRGQVSGQVHALDSGVNAQMFLQIGLNHFSRSLLHIVGADDG